MKNFFLLFLIVIASFIMTGCVKLDSENVESSETSSLVSEYVESSLSAPPSEQVPESESLAGQNVFNGQKMSFVAPDGAYIQDFGDSVLVLDEVDSYSVSYTPVPADGISIDTFDLSAIETAQRKISNDTYKIYEFQQFKTDCFADFTYMHGSRECGGVEHRYIDHDGKYIISVVGASSRYRGGTLLENMEMIEKHLVINE